MKRRIFTFGCSFTRYSWPTWADIILYGYEGYNLGQCGAGYDHIMYRVLECDIKYNLTQDDIIIVNFTTPIRFDIIKESSDYDTIFWECFGQSISSSLLKYKDKVYSINGLVYKSFSNIHLINNYLSSKKLNYYFTSIYDIFSNSGNYFEKINLYDEVIEYIEYTKTNIEFKISNMFDYAYPDSNEWQITKEFENKTYEYHLRPMQHYNWVNNVLLKAVDLDLKITKNDIIDIEDIINYANNMSEIDDSDTINKYLSDVDTRVFLPKNKFLK